MQFDVGKLNMNIFKHAFDCLLKYQHLYIS